MENASKALIIAGAILLSILIIGLGMFIFQQAAGSFDMEQFDATKAQTYNNKFLNYEGIQTGAQARQLCNLVIQHNLTVAKSDYTLYVQVLDGNGEINNANDASATSTAATMNTTVTTVRNAIKAGKNYEVTFGYDANTGYIVEVKIDEQ